MRRFTYLWFVLLMLYSAGASANALCPQPLRVALSDRGYASYRTADGYDGIAVDLLNAAAGRVGCKVEFVWLPSARVMTELKAQHVDIVPSLFQSSERDAIGAYIPYGYTRITLVLPKRVSGSYHSLADFVAHSDARLNMVRGIYLGQAIAPLLAQLERSARLEVVRDFDTLFRKIRLGRADAALTTPEVYLRHLQQELERDFTVLPIPELPPQIIGMYLSHSTVPPALLAAFARAVAAMGKDGTVRQIYLRHLPAPLVNKLFAPGPPPIKD